MIPFTTWLVWGLIGLVGGYMTSKLILDGRRTLVMLLAGIGGALLGGWLFMLLWWPEPGNAERGQLISLISAALGCALMLFFAVFVGSRVAPLDDDTPDDDAE